MYTFVLLVEILTEENCRGGDETYTVRVFLHVHICLDVLYTCTCTYSCICVRMSPFCTCNFCWLRDSLLP